MIKELCLIGLFSAGGFSYAGTLPDSIHETQLREVVITSGAANNRLQSLRIGAENLELTKMLALPSFGGENDILKSITLLPGVRSEGEGGGGFIVRGGNASQNLVSLDGITLYNPSHVMGIFSSFNDDALGHADLYKGPLPSRYGDAVSSVLDVSLAPGDMSRFHASATIGILAAKAAVAGPVVKDKLSFALTARRSYVDAFLKMIPKYSHTIMNFYDVTAKLRFRPSARHLVDGSFFMSRDNMAIANLMGLYWGNLGASLHWTADASDHLSFLTSASMTHFNPRMTMDIMNENQEMLTYIHDYSVTEQMQWTSPKGHTVDAGVSSKMLRVKSGEWSLNAIREKEVRSLWENSLWIDYSATFADRFSVTSGVRFNISSVLSGSRFNRFSAVYELPGNLGSKTYLNIDPSVNLKYDISGLHNLKLGFGLASQNLHAIQAGTTSFPFDRYALASADVKPERSIQYSAGYSGMTADGAFDWSAEGYFRHIANVYDYMDGRSTFSRISLESIILGGRGHSYGAEFIFRKNTGPVTGWISYSVSRTQSKIPGINGDRWYDSSNDRRHDFSVTALYRISDRWTLSASWMFLSGQPLTAPDLKYEIGGETCYYYSARNSYKTPPTHRLDLGATYTRVGRKFTSELAFGIYNAYCRYNPYIIYFQDDPSRPSGTRAVQRSLYGIIPSVSYTLRF